MPNKYYEGLNVKLFESIPSNSQNILELGCANGRLGELYKKNNPNTLWTGVDFSNTALDEASKRLDYVFKIDLNKEKLLQQEIRNDYDVIVLGDVLEHIINPESFLEQIYEVSSPNAKIICCLPNMTHHSVIQKIITGDMTYDEMGLLDKTHLRFYSPASAFKLFLDTGWLPNLKDQYRFEPPASEFLNGIAHSITSLGVPIKTALKNLGMYQMIIECQKWNNKVSEYEEDLKISVVIPINREWEFNENIKKSTGLKEINAEIIEVRNAKSAGEAFEFGKSKCSNEFILFAHQDVYFPKGSGFALLKKLAAIKNEKENFGVIGFAGLGMESNKNIVFSGLIIDRTSIFNYAPSSDVISIDELAIILHKDSELKIDVNLGWHTWATDLCIQAHANPKITNTQIIDVPIFHNSLNDYSLSKDYYESAKLLLQKYPGLKNIHTLCGVINDQSIVSN
jgi:2-polyprenyl-3-methyl-5-hydroxy-6-metoxy-1,4-benzoquinol methylase